MSQRPRDNIAVSTCLSVVEWVAGIGNCRKFTPGHLAEKAEGLRRLGRRPSTSHDLLCRISTNCKLRLPPLFDGPASALKVSGPSQPGSRAYRIFLFFSPKKTQFLWG